MKDLKWLDLPYLLAKCGGNWLFQVHADTDKWEHIILFDKNWILPLLFFGWMGYLLVYNPKKKLFTLLNVWIYKFLEIVRTCLWTNKNPFVYYIAAGVYSRSIPYSRGLTANETTHLDPNSSLCSDVNGEDSNAVIHKLMGFNS